MKASPKTTFQIFDVILNVNAKNKIKAENLKNIHAAGSDIEIFDTDTE